MVNYARIQAKIDKGLGIAGKHVGPPYTAYRIGTTSSGDFPSAWAKLQDKVPIYREVIPATKLDSPIKSSGTLWWQLFGGMADFLLGDVFVLNDPPYVPGISYGAGAVSVPGTLQFVGMALAWHSPAMVPVGGRIDRRVQIYRPGASPADVANSNVQYWKSTHDGDQPLVLANGVFSFGNVGGLASYVPCGFSAMERPITTPLMKPATPGVPYMMRYFAYLPPLPGYTPVEGDAIIDEDGSRYLVAHPYTQQTGAVGSQLLLDREISQN